MSNSQPSLILVLNCGSSSIKFALFDAQACPLPRKPLWHHFLKITIGIKQTPESWKDYLYWNISLDS